MNKIVFNWNLGHYHTLTTNQYSLYQGWDYDYYFNTNCLKFGKHRAASLGHLISLDYVSYMINSNVRDI